ncbi:MAG TPA: universal stress protein, partial [Saprospiraceae bacterium]|nr:universal stress protein [Saprospiraceae bacterium]
YKTINNNDTMKKILLPTDFSDTADKALQVAAKIGKIENSEIILMHTSLPTEGVNSNVYAAIYVHEYLETKRRNLKLLAEKVKESGYSGSIQTDNKVDFTVPAIVNASEEFDVDMVVMGSTGSSGLAGILIGSVASGVLAKIEKPLFLITHDFVLPEEGNLLIGTDYKTDINDDSREILRFFKEKLNFKLHLIHIAGDEADEEVLNKDPFVLHNFGDLIDTSVEVPGFKVEKALMVIQERYHNAVLCTITRKKNWFGSLFSHSVSKSLSHYTDIPLLCLQAK